MHFTELTENQQRVYIDAIQIYQAYREALTSAAKFKGTMRWKKSGGKEYLFRANDRYGNGKSLGPRTPVNEELKEKFMQSKHEAENRLRSLQDSLEEQARFCKAAKINRVPNIVTALLRNMSNQKLLGTSLYVVGTYSLYAYEAMAGIRFETGITATGDIDFLWHDTKKLHLNGELSVSRLMGVLTSTDKTFRRMKQKYKAVNSKGFEVDLIKRVPVNPFIEEKRTSIGNSDDLQAVNINSQKWITASQKVEAVVIGLDGFPAIISVPDPQVFVLHKLWMSKNSDRENSKKRRDRTQATAVAEVIIKHLPNYKFSEKELRVLPKKLIDNAKNESSMPADFKFTT